MFTLIKNLRKLMGIKEGESLYVFTSQQVSPPMSATIGDLVNNFGIDSNNLLLKYAIAEAWG